MMEVFKTGEQVRITYEGQSRSGTVRLASQNGKSLMLEFFGMLGGYVGMLPCLWNDRRAEFLDLIENKSVKVSKP
jgi:hypothetical protein